MADPETLDWTKLVIKLGDGQSSESFTAPCAVRSKTVTFTSQTGETYVVDCTTPGTPSFARRNVTGLSVEVTGAGAVDMNDWNVWRGFWSSGAAKNCQILFDMPLVDNGGHYSGPFILQSLVFSGDRDSEAGVTQFDFTLVSAGALTWTAASA